jgi:predicted transcriptional regulator
MMLRTGILVPMRTTVDLPEDTLRRVRHIAADRGTSVSRVIADLVTRAVEPTGPASADRITVDPTTGLKVLDLGRIITTEDVRLARDDE